MNGPSRLMEIVKIQFKFSNVKREKRERFIHSIALFFGDSSKFASCTHLVFFNFLFSYFGDEKFLFSLRLQPKYTYLLKEPG